MSMVGSVRAKSECNEASKLSDSAPSTSKASVLDWLGEAMPAGWIGPPNRMSAKTESIAATCARVAYMQAHILFVIHMFTYIGTNIVCCCCLNMYNTFLVMFL